MWCVVYAGDDREAKAEDFMKALLPKNVYTRCFHLVQHKAQRKQGVLRDVARKYLPGYVFIETNQPKAVHDILKKTPRRLLFSDEWFVSTLTAEEEDLLRLIVDEKGEIGLSIVRTVVDTKSGEKKNEYLSGPLMKVADKVSFVDYHRRYARIGVDFIDRKETLKLSFRFDGEEICGAAGLA